MFRGQVEPVEIGTALQREATDRKNIMGNGQVLCPNRYRVTLAPSDHERLQPASAVSAACGGPRPHWASCPSDREPRSRYPRQVLALRRLVLANRHLAALIWVAALALRLVVPSGYMMSSEHGRIAMTICSGVASQPASMDMPGMQGDGTGHGTSKHHDKAEMPCAFASLSAQALGAVDPVLLVAAIAFVTRVEPPPARSSARPITPYLRPPSRGPPAPL